MSSIHQELEAAHREREIAEKALEDARDDFAHACKRANANGTGLSYDRIGAKFGQSGSSIQALVKRRAGEFRGESQLDRLRRKNAALVARIRELEGTDAETDGDTDVADLDAWRQPA